MTLPDEPGGRAAGAPTAVAPTFALVVAPDWRGLAPATDFSAPARSVSARLEEAVGLARAIDLRIAGTVVAPVVRPRPATLIGAGKVAEIAKRLDACDPRPALVVVDAALSPVQHRNLEKAWSAKVLDRTALILEIFGARASTAEGRLQVDLAHLTYQRSRLVRSWTHLERQRGGAGFLGGPGERQIEADRRALSARIDRLKGKLEQVRRTRTLQRAGRKKAPQATVALVGYTNAGKSTLFNRIVGAGVRAEDMLFATLDPTLRAARLPSGETVVLSDTVGFVSDLPTELIAAFRATLEEVNEADILVHVRDVSHPDSEAQAEDVRSVLKALGLEGAGGKPTIEALNKVDALDPEDRAALEALSRARAPRAAGDLDDPVPVCVSAQTGEGVAALLAQIDALATRERVACLALLDPANGAARAWLHAHGEVGAETGAGLAVRLSAKARGRFAKAFPEVPLLDAAEAARADPAAVA